MICRIYTQICRLVDKFDSMFIKYREYGEKQFNFVISELEKDEGNVSNDVLALLKGCKSNVVWYYYMKK